MISSSKKSVQLLLQQCLQFGMKHFVISPGSRNAPLIIALNQHPEIETLVIPDERAAAFYALGMAQQLKAPVGIVCTSGSAPLNYYPAVAEAYYQQVPLVVLSADRPEAWVNQGDGQTIVQHDVFHNHIRYSVTLPEVTGSATELWYLSREISTALGHAIGTIKGPVHINIPFSEPLYEQVETDLQLPECKIIRIETPEESLSHTQLQFIKESWNKYEKKLIIVGQHEPDFQLLNALKDLVHDTSVAVLAENISNMSSPLFIHGLEQVLHLISPEELDTFAPDLLITIGDAVVSKKIKLFLRNYAPEMHWKAGHGFPFMDTYQSLTHSFPIHPARFIQALVNMRMDPNSNYGSLWKQKDFIAQEKTAQFLDEAPAYSDFSVFHTLLDYIPESSHLHMANSSVIRYCQFFDPVDSISYWCNRGTSGIDGSSSTACGAARITKDTWHTLITGDMSFFYDSNAFWNHSLTPNLRIFMINNAGGSIFKLIPGPGTTSELDRFFVYNHSFSAEHICKAFNITYFKANSLEEIEEQMEDFYQYDEAGSPQLMEIFTPYEINDQALAGYIESLKK